MWWDCKLMACYVNFIEQIMAASSIKQFSNSVELLRYVAQLTAADNFTEKGSSSSHLEYSNTSTLLLYYCILLTSTTTSTGGRSSSWVHFRRGWLDGLHTPQLVQMRDLGAEGESRRWNV